MSRNRHNLCESKTVRDRKQSFRKQRMGSVKVINIKMKHHGAKCSAECHMQ